MRDHIEHKLALLVTNDPAVEQVARREAAGTGDEIEHLPPCAALAAVLEGCGEEDFAIVDLEARPSGRRLLKMAGSAFPVVAVTRKVRPWLASLVRRHCIGAALEKPVSSQQMAAAIRHVRSMSARAGHSWV